MKLKIKLPKAVKTIGFIAIALMLSKVLGLLRESIFGRVYGSSSAAAAYGIASDIPVLFFDITLGAAVTSTFIPVFCGYLKESKQRAFEFANAFWSAILVISSSLTLLGIVFARPLTSFFAPGFVPETASLTSHLLIITLPTMVFTSIAYCLVGILQSLDEFNVPAVISVASNLVILAYLLFFADKFGIYGMAFAILIGWALQILIQIPSIIKKQFKPKFVLKWWREPGLKTAAKMALPILISSWVQPIFLQINKSFASFISEETVTALRYANHLYIMFVGVFSFAITNYIFPKLSQAESEDFNAIIKKSIWGIVALITPIMLGTIIFALPLIKLVYMGGEFTLADAQRTASALAFYAPGMIALGVNEILTRACYAKKDGVTPMLAAVIGIATNLTIVISLFFLGKLTITALALSGSIGSNAMMITLLLRKKRLSL